LSERHVDELAALLRQHGVRKFPFLDVRDPFAGQFG
jgi:hypothetical protein